MKIDDTTPSIIHQADTILDAVRSAQDLEEIKNDAKRQAERQAKIDVWQDPEVMKERHLNLQLQSLQSLRSLKASGGYASQFPLPPDEELPLFMRGQQPSTVRRWMHGQSKYSKMIKKFENQDDESNKSRAFARAQNPELFGLGDREARSFMSGKSTDTFSLRTGKTIKVNNSYHPVINSAELVKALKNSVEDKTLSQRIKEWWENR